MTEQRFQCAIELLGDNATLMDTRRLTGGVSADVYALDIKYADNTMTTVVFRQHNNGEDRHQDRATTTKEYNLLHALHDMGLPVPEPLALAIDNEQSGGPFWLMSFIDGQTDIAQQSLNTCLQTMAGMLTKLHTLPTRNLPELPQRTNPVPEVFDYFPRGQQWRTLKTFLQTCEHCEYQGVPALLHGDYWSGNLLWQDLQLVGILDWEDAAVGDPMCDLAASRMEVLWKHGYDAMGVFTEAYRKHHAVDDWRMALWHVYVGTAAMRYMGQWGLDPAYEAHMRACSLELVTDAARVVQTTQPDKDRHPRTPQSKA
jgi:aminoglycoside phosphotransferase (APT) family kinase protein